MTTAKVALIWQFIYTEPNLKTCACLEHHHCSFSTLQALIFPSGIAIQVNLYQHKLNFPKRANQH